MRVNNLAHLQQICAIHALWLDLWQLSLKYHWVAASLGNLSWLEHGSHLQGAFARCSCQAAHAGSSPSLMHFFNLTFILHFSEWLWSGQGVTVKSGYWLNLRLCSAACHDCYIRAHSIPQYPTSYNVVTPLSTIESLQRVKIDVNMSLQSRSRFSKT